jgi:hypothetical protein
VNLEKIWKLWWIEDNIENERSEEVSVEDIPF